MRLLPKEAGIRPGRRGRRRGLLDPGLRAGALSGRGLGGRDGDEGHGYEERANLHGRDPPENHARIPSCVAAASHEIPRRMHHFIYHAEPLRAPQVLLPNPGPGDAPPRRGLPSGAAERSGTRRQARDSMPLWEEALGWAREGWNRVSPSRIRRTTPSRPPIPPAISQPPPSHPVPVFSIPSPPGGPTGAGGVPDSAKPISGAVGSMRSVNRRPTTLAHSAAPRGEKWLSEIS
jgi:hypothetical protein